jgi:zinc protease
MHPSRWLLVCLAAGCATHVLPEEAVFSPRNFPQHDNQLPSGLRVVLQEDHSASLITVAAVYGVGSTSDPEGAGGVAHVVEHLTFRPRTDEVSRAERLSRAGAVFNAITGADSTLYFAVGDRESLDDLLRVEVARLIAPLEGVTPEEFETERQVVLNERRERQFGTTGPAVISVIQEQLFPASHPLSRPLIGSEASLAKVTWPMAQAFVEQHYRPENCTLVISGDVDPARVKELMKSWPARATTSADGRPVAHRPPLALGVKRPLPRVAVTRPVTMKGPVAKRSLMLAWSLPAATPENEARLRIIRAVMGAVAENYDAAVDLAPLADGSILMVSRELGPKERPERVRERLINDLTGEGMVNLAMRATPMIRSLARTAILREIADPIECALQLTRHVAATGRLSFYRDTMNQMRAVTMDAVARTMRDHLRSERTATVLIEPEGVVLAQPGAREAHDLLPAVAASSAGMSPADVLRVARPPGLDALPRFSLPNGLQVSVIQWPGTPLASVDLFLPGGSATEVPYGELVSDVSGNTCQQAVELGAVGGSARADHGKFASHLAVTVPDGNLLNGLAALADEARCRSLSYRGYEVYRALVHLARDAVPPAEVNANRDFWKELYPKHPYGRTVDFDALERMTTVEANDYLAAHFTPNAAVAVVTSALPASAVRPLVEDYFGGWQPAQRIAHFPPKLPPPIPHQRQFRLLADTRRAQVRLRIGCRLPMNAGALPALDVVERLVKAQANHLRHSWGATYGVSVDVGLFPGSAHLVLESAVEAGRVGEALTHLLGVLTRNASEGPDPDRFTVARWEVARGFNLRFATSNGMASALLLSAQQGWPAAEWDRYPRYLAAVDPARVQYLMKSCAAHEVITLIGDVPTLQAQLQAAGLQ